MVNKINRFNFLEKNQSIFIFLSFSILIFSSLVVAQATFDPDDPSLVPAICEEQLQYCIDEFNSLLSDFWNGTNCEGESFNYLKEKNWELTLARDDYKEEAEELREYKYGFFVLAGLILILIFFNILRENKFWGLKDARTTGNKRKKKNR